MNKKRWFLLLALAAAAPLPAQDFSVATLERPASASNEFGAAVSAEAGQVAIGDPGANLVYVYRREGDELVLEIEIPLPPPEFLPSDFVGNPRFGASLDLALGAYCLDLTTCPGHALVIGAPEVELVDVWSRNNPALLGGEPIWEPVLTFTTGDVVAELFGDLFGTSVALTEDSIVIGAPAAFPDGEVYVFSRDGFDLLDILGLDGSVLRKGGPPAGFGSSMAYKNGQLGIGAPSALGAGVVQLYSAISGNLANAGMATGSSGDGFGTSISIDGGMVATGAPGAGQGVGNALVFSFGDPDLRRVVINDPSLQNVGSSVALDGTFVIAGASSGGFPVATLRSQTDPTLDVRLNGDLVAAASPEVFIASDRDAGQVSFAVDRSTIFSADFER